VPVANVLFGRAFLFCDVNHIARSLRSGRNSEAGKDPSPQHHISRQHCQQDQPFGHSCLPFIIPHSIAILIQAWKLIYEEEKWQEDEPEDTSDVEWLLKRQSGAGKVDSKPRLPPKISGNDYCPCRSGKKYKKCCGAVGSPS
jgi:hypothetical protein